MGNLMRDVKLTKVAAGAVSAGTDVTSDILDMSGYDGVVFFATIATVNAGNYIKVQQDTDAAGGTMADLTGTKVVGTTNANTVCVDVYRPQERYVRAIIIRGGTNTVTGDIYALQYRNTRGPLSAQGATIDIEYHVSPAEGTA